MPPMHHQQTRVFADTGVCLASRIMINYQWDDLINSVY